MALEVVDAARLRDEVEEEWVVGLVVLARDARHRHRPQLVAAPREEVVVRGVRVVLDQLAEVVRGLLGPRASQRSLL